MSIHRPFTGSPAADGDLVSLTPDDAKWDWTGLRVVRLFPGRPVRMETGPNEVFVLPLRGALGVEVSDAHQSGSSEAKFDLDGRASVFSAVTDFAYAGRDGVILLEIAPRTAGRDSRSTASIRFTRLPVMALTMRRWRFWMSRMRGFGRSAEADASESLTVVLRFATLLLRAHSVA